MFTLYGKGSCAIPILDHSSIGPFLTSSMNQIYRFCPFLPPWIYYETSGEVCIQRLLEFQVSIPNGKHQILDIH